MMQRVRSVAVVGFAIAALVAWVGGMTAQGADRPPLVVGEGFQTEGRAELRLATVRPDPMHLTAERVWIKEANGALWAGVQRTFWGAGSRSHPAMIDVGGGVAFPFELAPPPHGTLTLLKWGDHISLYPPATPIFPLGGRRFTGEPAVVLHLDPPLRVASDVVTGPTHLTPGAAVMKPTPLGFRFSLPATIPPGADAPLTHAGDEASPFFGTWYADGVPCALVEVGGPEHVLHVSGVTAVPLPECGLTPPYLLTWVASARATPGASATQTSAVVGDVERRVAALLPVLERAGMPVAADDPLRLAADALHAADLDAAGAAALIGRVHLKPARMARVPPFDVQTAAYHAAVRAVVRPYRVGFRISVALCGGALLLILRRGRRRPNLDTPGDAPTWGNGRWEAVGMVVAAVMVAALVIGLDWVLGAGQF